MVLEASLKKKKQPNQKGTHVRERSLRPWHENTPIQAQSDLPASSPEMEIHFLNARTLQNRNEQKARHFELQSHLHSDQSRERGSSQGGAPWGGLSHVLSKEQCGSLTPVSLVQSRIICELASPFRTLQTAFLHS